MYSVRLLPVLLVKLPITIYAIKSNLLDVNVKSKCNLRTTPTVDLVDHGRYRSCATLGYLLCAFPAEQSNTSSLCDRKFKVHFSNVRPFCFFDLFIAELVKTNLCNRVTCFMFTDVLYCSVLFPCLPYTHLLSETYHNNKSRELLKVKLISTNRRKSYTIRTDHRWSERS